MEITITNFIYHYYFIVFNKFLTGGLGAGVVGFWDVVGGYYVHANVNN